jgi:transposase InsO family protein
MKAFHWNPTSSHEAKEKLVQRMKPLLWWTSIRKDAAEYVEHCEVCQKIRRFNQNVPIQERRNAKTPMERISLDIMSIELKTGDSKDLLVIMDEFTRYPEVITMPNMTAKTTARLLFDNWILRYGIPKEIITDRGSNFLSELFMNLCQLLRIQKISTTAYRPQSNGANERVHRTLYTILRSLKETQSLTWERQLATSLYVYRTSYHKVIGMTPHEALFGYRPPQVTLDEQLCPEFEEEDAELVNGLSEETWLIKRLQAMQKARETMYRTMYEKQRITMERANRRAKTPTLRIGDRVLVKAHVRRKLDPFWDQTGTIIAKKSDVDFLVQFDDPHCKRHPLIHAAHLRSLKGDE